MTLGYTSHNIISNLGTIALIILWYFVMLIVVMLILRPLSYFSKKIKKRYLRSKRKMIFGELFSFIFEGFFGIFYAAILNLVSREDDVDNNFINKSISISLLCIILIFLPMSLVKIFV